MHAYALTFTMAPSRVLIRAPLRVVGLAVRLRALGAQVRVCAPPDCAAAEGCGALAATGVVPAGVWR